MSIWAVLGIAPVADRSAIRRAYAQKLRITNPEDDAEGFKQLRAAYEMALHYADDAAAWTDDAGDAADQPEIAPARADPGPHFRSEAVAEPENPPDVADVLAAREAGIVQLNALLGTLDAALRSPWRGDERAIGETFAAILRAPAMAEIRVQADVEQWVAGLLAATIPRSDAILAEAVTAFRWADERPGSTTPAIAAILARLDEWRIIEGLNRDGHPLHPAWRSLTRPAGAWWSWRIDAFRPGMETGVDTLLGARGPIAPGLAYSFKADSVARWRRFLERPHWTLGMFAAIPVVLLLYLAMQDALGDPIPQIAPWADWVVGAAVVLSPFAPFLARFGRTRWLRVRHPDWLNDGWVAALAVVLIAAMIQPASPAALAALAAATALVWLWMAVAGGSAAIEEVKARLRANWLTVIACGFFTVGAVASLDPVHRAALALMMALGATVMVGPLTRVGAMLARVSWWRAAFAVPVALAFAAIAFGDALFSASLRPGRLFYAGGLTLIAGLIVTAAARSAGVRGNGEHNILRVLKGGLVGVFLFGAIVAMDDHRIVPDQAPPHGQDAPLAAADPDGLRGPILTALDASTDAPGALAELRKRIAGFDRIARGNPSFKAAIIARVRERDDGLVPNPQVADSLLQLLASNYAARLPTTSNALLLQEISIRHARMIALRSISAEACLKPRTVIDESGLPEALRTRQTAQTFDVLSSPPGSMAERYTAAFSSVRLGRMVAHVAHMRIAALNRAATDKATPAARCEAHIALLAALDDAPDRDRAAATMRQLVAIAAERPDAGLQVESPHM